MITDGVRLLEMVEDGYVLGRKQAILANCALCQKKYRDGRKDCGIRDCLFYPFMPYRVGRASASVDGSAGGAGK